MNEEQKKAPKKGKTLRIISWILLALAAVVWYFALTAGDEKTADALPEPEVRIASVIQGKKLSLDCILPAETDAATLEKVAAKVYRSNAGSSFDNVFIMWYLPGEKIGAGAWATSNKHGRDADLKTQILKLQQLQKQAESAAK